MGFKKFCEEKMIDISVIIPAYNSSKTILRCLNSLEQNSFSNYEIIVIDDYSSDETASIVRDFILQGNDNVVLLNNSKNLGPSYSRKIGIEKAKGKSLAFVDSDDYVEPHFLDLLCEARLNKNAQIIIYDYFVVKRNGKKKRHNVLPDLKIYSKDSRLVLSVDSFWTCLIDKELFKEVDFPNIRNGEDMAVIPQ